MSIATEVRVREMGDKIIEQERELADLRRRIEVLESAQVLREAVEQSPRKTLRLDRGATQ